VVRLAGQPAMKARACRVGEGNALLWTLGDIVWGGFLACALALIVLSVGVLVRSLTRSWRARSSGV
jgi:hypothetical protein